MRRKLLSLLSGLSLLMCMLTVALWMRSYWTAEQRVHVGSRGPRGSEGRLLTFDIVR